MGEYYIKRYKNHLKELSKYSKYVFNDHLMIILFFLFGGLMLSYINFLDHGYKIPVVLGRLLVLVISLVLIKIGKLATLFQEADSVFLLPKEAKLKQYLDKSLVFSFIVPLVCMLFSFFFLWPLIKMNHIYSLVDYLALIFTIAIFKWDNLIYQGISVYLKTVNINWQKWLIPVALLLIFLPYGVYGSLMISILNTIYLLSVYKKKSSILDFTKAIELEKARMQQIYKFLNLFTDVPNIQITVKRRKYLDGLINKIPKIKSNTYRMLYYSELCRGNVYGGLLIRLSLISLVIVILSNSYTFSLIISAIFLFLLLIQCLSLYQEFDYQLLTKIYPISKQIKKQNFRKVMMELSLVMIIIDILGFLRYGLIYSLIGAAILILFSVIFNYLYLPSYLKKQN